MRNLQKIISDAENFKRQRGNLANGIKSVDEKYKAKLSQYDLEHKRRLEIIESERQSNITSANSKAQKNIADYAKMKGSLQEYGSDVRQWCPQSELSHYVPNPERVNESELNQLLKMLQEQGVIAWIKRTFRLAGYSSRKEMALSLCKKIEDACAYCNDRISAIEKECEIERGKIVTA